MFQLHETTRRRWLRSGFVLLALGPTLAIAASAAWLRRPEYRERVAERLGDRLGLAVKLSAVRHPRPGVVLLDGVELLDPESGALRGRARLIEIETADDLTTIVPSQAEIELADGAFWGQLAQAELRRRQPSSGKLRFAAGEVTLRMPAGAQTLTDVRCQIEVGDAGSQAAVSFRVAGQDEAEPPATLSIVRNRRTTPASFACEAHTGGAALAAGLLAAAWPPAARLGPDARFRGSLRALQGPAGWEGELTGELAEVDLDELVTSRFRQKLGGRATLRLELARFRGSQVQQASGALTVERGGVVGQSLLAAGAETLGLARIGEVKTLGRLVRYDRLALGFVVDEHGLALRGQCPSGDGIVLEDRSGPLLKEPPRASQPVVNFVSLLAPEGDVAASPTREMLALAAFLPTPSLSPPTGSEERLVPAAARLRLRRAADAPRR